MVGDARRAVVLARGASFFLLGAGPILWMVGSTTLRQAITPRT